MTNAEAISLLRGLEKSLDEYCELNEDGKKAFSKAISALEAQEWVPVSERLPEEGRDVLFCDIDGDIMIGYHNKGKPDTHFSQQGTYERIKNVKAWMPLPEPYRESEDKE